MVQLRVCGSGRGILWNGLSALFFWVFSCGFAPGWYGAGRWFWAGDVAFSFLFYLNYVFLVILYSKHHSFRVRGFVWGWYRGATGGAGSWGLGYPGSVTLPGGVTGRAMLLHGREMQ